MSDAYVTEKRNNVIDYMKGIAIILMVLRHAGTPGTEIVEIFHMALFFMVSTLKHTSLYGMSPLTPCT